MRMHVVLDMDGRIVGTGHLLAGEGVPSHARLVAGPGQTVHEIEVEEEFARLEPAELHRRLAASGRLPKALDLG
jgi:hypothetical protein